MLSKLLYSYVRSTARRWIIRSLAVAFLVTTGGPLLFWSLYGTATTVLVFGALLFALILQPHVKPTITIDNKERRR